MWKRCGALLALICPAASLAAGFAVQPAAMVTTADVSAMIAASRSGLATTADVAAVQANMCAPTAMIPPGEVVGGAAGSGNQCRLANAIQPRITRTAACTLGAPSNGISTCDATWEGSPFAAGTTIRLAGEPAVVTASAGASTEQPMKCKAYAITVTGISFRCWQAQGSVLNATIVTAGLTVLPYAAAAGGVTVQVTALPSS